MSLKCNAELKPEVLKIFTNYCHKQNISVEKMESLDRRKNNFLSDVSKVQISGRHTPSDTEYKASFIVKELPTNNKYVEMYNCDIAFRNECFAYESIIPNLRNYAPNPLPFPHCIHSNDKLVILEDLSEQGFQHFDKLTGFNVDLVKSTLAELANIHAASLIMKEKNPKKFQNITSTVNEVLYRTDVDNVILKTQENTIDMVIALIKSSSSLKNLKKIQQLRGKTKELQMQLLHRQNSPFSVINHGDIWANNILINTDTNSIKLIDFQIMRHTSLAADLNYFLYVNLDPDFRIEHEIQFLTFYLEELLKLIRPYELEVEAYLTMDNLLEEMQMYALFGFICGLWIMPVFYHSLERVDENENEQENFDSVQMRIKSMCPAQTDRLLRLVQSYAH